MISEAHATARRVLALQLADVLHEHHVTADTAESMPEDCWTLARRLVAVRRGGADVAAVPSAETRAAAVDNLRAFERIAAKQPVDPFEGLPGATP